jgi:hypothetical protein
MHRYLFVFGNLDLPRRLELLSLVLKGVAVGQQVQVFYFLPYGFQALGNRLAGALYYEVLGEQLPEQLCEGGFAGAIVAAEADYSFCLGHYTA